MKCRVFQLKKSKAKKILEWKCSPTLNKILLQYVWILSFDLQVLYNKLVNSENQFVYSFGIVPLEIVTSRPAMLKPPENAHKSRWVSSILAKADIKRIVDLRLQANFDINSAWKVVDLAMACVSETATTRPTMSQVVMDLKQCLEVEISRTKGNNETKSKYPIPEFGLNFTTGLRPTAR